MHDDFRFPTLIGLDLALTSSILLLIPLTISSDGKKGRVYVLID